MFKSAAKRIISGYWDGEPIWHYETAAERLWEALKEQARENHDKKVAELEEKKNKDLTKESYG